MKFDLLILDFDGTLCDTRATIVKTLRMTMEKVGLPLKNEDECAATIGLPLAGAYKKMFPYLSESEAIKCADTYRIIFEENKAMLKPKLFPNVVETIKALAQMGIHLSIASSRNKRSLREFVEEFGLKDYINIVIGADDVHNAKPHPEPVLRILEHFNVVPEKTLVVGDMNFDIDMGKNANCHTCAVTYGNATREELSGADYIIDSIDELVSICS